VPLSEHEQRLLDEIEQALYAEDPKFAASVRSARAPSKTRRLAILCIAGVLVGLALVFVGLFTTLIPLSVVGFVLVVGAAGYAATGLRHRGHARNTGTPTTNVRPIRPGGLRGRMEDRLRRRFDEN
jgi:F0F1-type ATP synthase assembly protein I